MFCDVGADRIKISWRHRRVISNGDEGVEGAVYFTDDLRDVRPQDTIESKGGMTECMIEDADSDVHANVADQRRKAGYGTATCSLVENYSRAVGRKFSLRRALLNKFPGKENKDLRAVVWDQYLDKCGQD